VKSILLLTILILTSWIVSYGQASDTVKCYNIAELRKIATLITQKQECDTVLGLTNARVVIQDSLISNYQEQIYGFKTTLAFKDTIIQNQGYKIAGLEKSLKSTKNYTIYGSLTLLLLLILIR